MKMVDEKLIEQAWRTNPTEWWQIDSLIEQACSDATKEKLITIRNSKYHEEEYECGCS